jgi:hypothetical protein
MTTRRRLTWLFIVSVSIASLAPQLAHVASAQVTADGSIRGTVRDEQGAVLPGVAITATSPTAPRPVVAVSDADGTYRLLNLVINPLATSIRFVGPTRGDGQIETDPLTTLNLRVGKAFRFGARKLEVAYDLFNALNADAFQQFKSGGNQIYSANYALARNGSIQGQSRQFARARQLSIRLQF